MSLPNIFHAAGGYAELVAYAPVLNMFDNSEVEILNPIPDFNGFPAYLGQFLALALVALGSVKKIYVTNESNGRKKRSNDKIEIFLHIIQMVDQQQCARRFLCSLGEESKKNELSLDKLQLLKLIKKFRMVTGELFNALTLGTNAQKDRSCSIYFPRCPITEESLSKLFTNVRKTFVNSINIMNAKKRAK